MLNRFSPTPVAPPRTVACPDCRHLLPIVRQAPPFEVACRRCHRLVRVTEAGISRVPSGRGLRSTESPRSSHVVLRPDRPGPPVGMEDRTFAAAPGPGPWRRRIRRVGIILTSLLTAAGAITWIVFLIVAFKAPVPSARSVVDRTAAHGIAGTVDHEVGLRHEAVRRYDQYLVRAESDPEGQDLWRELRRRELEEIGRLEQYAATRRAGSGPTGARPFLDY